MSPDPCRSIRNLSVIFRHESVKNRYRSEQPQPRTPICLTIFDFINYSCYKLDHFPAPNLLDYFVKQKSLLKRLAFQWRMGKFNAGFSIAPTEREFISRFNLRAKLMPLGVPLEEYDSAERGAFRRKHALGNRPVVLASSRVTPHKGQDIAVEIAAHVVRQYPQAMFVVAGAIDDHAYYAKMTKRVSELGLDNNVLFTEAISRAEMSQAYVDSDLNLVPVRFMNFGLVILEGWAARKPLVQSDRADPNLVQEGIDGLTFPFGNIEAAASAVCRLLADEKTPRLHGTGRAKEGRRKLHLAKGRPICRCNIRRNNGQIIIPPSPARHIMGLSKTIVRNTAATYLRFVIVLLVQFFTFPYLLNTLGEVAFGIYGFFWAIAGYLVLLDLGMSSAVVKYVAKCKAVADWLGLNKIVSTIFTIYLAFGLLALVVTGVIILMLPAFQNFRELPPDMLANARLAFVMIGLNIAMVLILSTFRSMLIGVQRLDLVNFAEAAIQVLYGISIFAFIHGPKERAAQNLLIATTSFTAATFLTGIAYIVMTWRAFPHAKISFRLFDRTQLRELFSFSLAVIILRIAIMFTYGTDQIILGIFAVFATVAIYQIAVRTSEMVRTFVSSASNVFEPLVSELHSAARGEDLSRLYLLFTKMSFSVGLPIVMLAMIFLQPFIVAWTLETNQTVPWVLAILLIVALLDLTHISASKVLLMTEKHWYQTKVWVIGSLAFLASSVILVSVVPAGYNDVKMIGIALNKLVFLIILFAIIMSYTFSTIGASWRAFFGKCVLPVLAAAVGVALRLYSYPLIYYMEKGEQHVNRAHSLLNMAWQGALAFAVYVVSWWFIALTAEERRKFKTVFHSYLHKLPGQTPTPESPV